MTDAEWDELLKELDAHRQHIEAWEPDAPKPDAARCVQSRHRTLAHLRACQETWLAACLAFAERPGASLKLLHPWRLFDQQSYALGSWDEHRRAFLTDRQRLLELLRTCDRTIGGKVNGNSYTIESLIAGRVAAHERHHLFDPR
ncbi:MAG: hypothetical protein JST12_19760 [Armatimonadetes bacterium]|nr:hypothetical protein [Armatimonadota bacterium]